MKVLIHNGRVYHGDDTKYTGPSITLKAYHQGANPPPPPPQAPPPEPPPEPPLAAITIRAMTQAKAEVLRQMSAEVPAPPATLDAAVAWRKEHWGETGLVDPRGPGHGEP